MSEPARPFRRTWYRGATWALVVLSLGWAWLAWARWVGMEGPDYETPKRFLPHWGAWLAMVALAYALGCGVLARTLDGRIAWRWIPRWVAALLLGYAAWAFLSALLLLLGAWTATRLYLLGAIAAAVPFIRLADPWRALVPPCACRTARRPVRRPIRRVSAVCATLVAIVGTTYWVEAQLPPTQWDSLSYHLALPRLYARAGEFVPHPHYTSRLPHYPQLLGMTSTAIQDSVVASGVRLLHVERLDHVIAQSNTWLIALMIVAMMVRAGRTMGFPAAGWIGAVLLLLDRSFEYQAPSAYVELWGAAYVMATLLLLLERRREVLRGADAAAGAERVWPMVGVFGGMLLGIKYLYPLYVLPVCLVALAQGRPPRAALLRRPALWCGIALAVALAAPWVAKSWRLTGTPLFPFGLQWATLDPIEIENARQIDPWFAAIGQSDDPLRFVRFPLALAFETGTPYRFFSIPPYSPGPLWVIPLLTLLLLRRWRGSRGRMLLTLAAAYVIWFLAVRQARFLLTVFPLLFLLTGVGALLLLRLVRRPRLRGAVAAVMVTAVLAFDHQVLLDRFSAVGHHWRCMAAWQNPVYEAASGKVPNFAAHNWLSEHLGKGASIGMLMDNRSYYLAFPIAFTDSVLEAPLWRLLLEDRPEFGVASRRFRERGCSVLIVNLFSLDHYAGISDDAEFVEAAAYLRAYLDSPFVRTIHRDPTLFVGVPLLEAAPPAPTPAVP